MIRIVLCLVSVLDSLPQSSSVHYRRRVAQSVEVGGVAPRRCDVSAAATVQAMRETLRLTEWNIAETDRSHFSQMFFPQQNDFRDDNPEYAGVLVYCRVFVITGRKMRP